MTCDKSPSPERSRTAGNTPTESLPPPTSKRKHATSSTSVMPKMPKFNRTAAAAAAVLVLFLATAAAAADDNSESTTTTALASPKVLSRHRRLAVPAMSGWSFTFSVALSIPLSGISTSLGVSTSFTYSFDSGLVTGRSIMDNEQERYGFLKTIEKYATQFLKVSGHSCMQRVICETAETPFHMDGLLGEVANAFLTPNNLLDAIPELANEDYVEAQTLGRAHGNCTQYYDACPISIFQIVDEPDDYYDFLSDEEDDMYHGDWNNQV